MKARAFLFTAEGALRAPWRLLAFLAAAMVALAITQPAGFMLAGVSLEDAAPDRLSMPVLLASSWGMMMALLIAHLVSVRWIDRRDWSFVGMDYGAARGIPVARGFLLGAATIGAPTLLLVATRWMTVVPAENGDWLYAAAVVTLIVVPASLAEELLFRGYPFAVVSELWGSVAAVALTSIAFGVLHFQNLSLVDGPVHGIQAIATVILAGVFLGAVRLKSGSLYAVWAAHAAWNWTLAALLHTEVSGIPFASPGYRVVDSGPDWLTGGDWGPEGGAAAAIFMLIALAWLIARPRRREES
ncbi:MAG: lysostaphin resistance A-like protein [Gemmatimonadaceae bacterium]